MQFFVCINPNDNVIVTLRSFSTGETVSINGSDIKVHSDIPAGHKIATAWIKRGEDVIKYGYPIGRAKEEIKPGDWVHTHNVITNLEGTLQYTYQPKGRKVQPKSGAAE